MCFVIFIINVSFRKNIRMICCYYNTMYHFFKIKTIQSILNLYKIILFCEIFFKKLKEFKII